ncbi:NADH dehydrogenase I chain C; chain D [Salmonella enterica subsp. arizonae]|nr:NADH dehydrogenase I chain C; chain D [Salmonella enterica subsp. arizonae]
MEALTFKPEDWGMKRGTDNEDFMFLNLGPNHPSAHGAFRIILQLDGEEIVDCVPDIGYHPPWRREDGRTPVLAQLHSVHRPY